MMPARKMAEPHTLAGLLHGLTTAGTLPEAGVTGVALDSRKVQPGDLFVAVAGSCTHGLHHARLPTTHEWSWRWWGAATRGTQHHSPGAHNVQAVPDRDSNPASHCTQDAPTASGSSPPSQATCAASSAKSQRERGGR